MAEICNLPLRTKQEPDEALSEDELYKAISTFLSFTSFPLDAADAWNLRRECREQTEKLKQAIMSRVRKMERGCGGIGLLSGHFQPAQAGSLKEVGEKLTKRLLSTYSVENTACSLIGSAAGGMFLPHQFTITLDWFLRPENEKYWMMVKDFASQGTSEANEKLKKAVLEAQRLSSATGFSRVCVPERGETIQISEQGKPIMLKKGNVIICNTVGLLFDFASFSLVKKSNPMMCVHGRLLPSAIHRNIRNQMSSASTDPLKTTYHMVGARTSAPAGKSP